MKKCMVLLASFLATVVFPGSVSAQDVKIEWDSHGIPHITAPTDEGVLYGQGYAMALCQAPSLYRVYARAMGISAKYFGCPALGWKDAYALNDYRVKLWRLPEMAAEVCGSMDPKIYGLLEAFCRGIEDAADQYWRNNPALSAMEQRLMAEMRVSPLEVSAACMRLYLLPLAETHAHAVAEGAADQDDFFPTEGSNAWALLGRDDGAWLMIDPHVRFGLGSDAVDTAYHAFVCSLDGETLHTRGYNALGLPLQSVGVKLADGPGDQVMGWTFTSAPPDMVDVYELAWDVEGDRYLMEDGPKAFLTEPVSIEFPGGESLAGQCKYTLHGPVVKEVGEAGKVFAGRAVWQVWPKACNMVEQWYRMLTAKNLDDLFRAMETLALPGGNMIIATSASERRERICYTLFLPVPRRHSDDLDWTQPVDGSEYRNLWHQVHARDELPTVFGDEQDYFINCNCSVDVTWPGFRSRSLPKYLIYDWNVFTFRQERAEQLLAGRRGDFRLMHSAATDASYGFARHLVPFIANAYTRLAYRIPTTALKDLARLLVAWLEKWLTEQDARCDAESKEIFFFKKWERVFRILGEKQGRDYMTKFFTFASDYNGLAGFDEMEGIHAITALLTAFYQCKATPLDGWDWGSNHKMVREFDGEMLAWGVSGDRCSLRSAHGKSVMGLPFIPVVKGQVCPMIVKVADAPEIWFSKAVDNCTLPSAAWIFDEQCPCTRDWCKGIYLRF